MKNWNFVLIALLLASNGLYAETIITTEKNTPSPPVNWISKDNSDTVTINNGTNANLSINIAVNGGKIGVDVKNCGQTTHIDPGSSAICLSNDSSIPVSFAADSPNNPASGTYQIQQQSN